MRVEGHVLKDSGGLLYPEDVSVDVRFRQQLHCIVQEMSGVFKLQQLKMKIEVLKKNSRSNEQSLMEIGDKMFALSSKNASEYSCNTLIPPPINNN